MVSYIQDDDYDEKGWALGQGHPRYEKYKFYWALKSFSNTGLTYLNAASAYNVNTCKWSVIECGKYKHNTKSSFKRVYYSYSTQTSMNPYLYEP